MYVRVTERGGEVSEEKREDFEEGMFACVEEQKNRNLLLVACRHLRGPPQGHERTRSLWGRSTWTDLP